MSRSGPCRVLHLAGCWYPTAHTPTSGVFIRRHVQATEEFADASVLHLDLLTSLVITQIAFGTHPDLASRLLGRLQPAIGVSSTRDGEPP